MDIVIGEYKLSIGKNSIFYPANGNKKKGGGIPLQYFEEKLLPKFRILNDEGFIKNEMQFKECVQELANAVLPRNIKRRVNTRLGISLSYFLDEFKKEAPVILEEKIKIIRANKSLDERARITREDIQFYIKDIWDKVEGHFKGYND